MNNINIKGSFLRKNNIIGGDDLSDKATVNYYETKKIARRTSIIVSLIVGILASLIASYIYNNYMHGSVQNNKHEQTTVDTQNN